MDFWIDLWTVFFFASLAIFAGLAIVVSIGGFFNIRTLFKTLTEQTGLQGDTGPDTHDDES